jgi:hypothetical protein
MRNKNTFNADLVQYAIDGMDSISVDSTYGCDLHHELFNTDYFIIGTFEAKEWLKENVGVFEAIQEVQEYENSNFGVCYTDLSNPERLVNMYAYIQGELILHQVEILYEKWDEKLTESDIEEIKKELEELL